MPTVSNLRRRTDTTGGLLARSDGYCSINGSWATNNYYHADGSGNVTYLENSSQGLAASYVYDPSGNTISSSGTLAYANNDPFCALIGAADCSNSPDPAGCRRAQREIGLACTVAGSGGASWSRVVF